VYGKTVCLFSEVSKDEDKLIITCQILEEYIVLFDLRTWKCTQLCK